MDRFRRRGSGDNNADNQQLEQQQQGAIARFGRRGSGDGTGATTGMAATRRGSGDGITTTSSSSGGMMRRRGSGDGGGQGGGNNNLDSMKSSSRPGAAGRLDDHMMMGGGMTMSGHGATTSGRSVGGGSAAAGGAIRGGMKNTSSTTRTTKTTDHGNKRGERGGGGGPLDSLPEEFLYHPHQATPQLFFLPKLQAAAIAAAAKDFDGTASSKTATPLPEFIPLDVLLHSAEEDVRLHRARVKAGTGKDNRLLRTYQLETDSNAQARSKRLVERSQIVSELQSSAYATLSELYDENLTKGLTQSERTQVKLEKWSRALELYVNAHEYELTPPTSSKKSSDNKAMTKDASAEKDAASASTTKEEGKDGGGGDDKTKATAAAATITTSTSTSTLLMKNLQPLDWQSTFQSLLDGATEEQDISPILAQASTLCQNLVDSTKVQVQDSAQHVRDVETSYRIRLEAHEHYGRSCLVQVGDIDTQFTSNGKAALQIGHQLEQAEKKRSQCESASNLIRRWWMMENLAEQEQQSIQAGHGVLDVDGEVNGKIPVEECKMDHLFILPESSLEAAQTLQSLRAVIRSRGSASAAAANAAAQAAAAAVSSSSSKTGADDKGGAAAAAAVVQTGGGNARRLDSTASLLARTSAALERRLLTTFEHVYAAGGLYDFSHKPRAGAMDWRELRSLAKALLTFDSGRLLHSKYVEMVVSLRFPELFDKKKAKAIMKKSKKDDVTGGDGDDDTRSESDHKDSGTNLSAAAASANDDNFDIDETRAQLSSLFHRVSDICTQEFELIARVFSSSNARTNLLEGSEEMPLVVARTLLQRVVSDPTHGLQARIHQLLHNIDKLGDFEAGAKKLDTFVVIHEKAAGLFGLLRDAADNMVLDDDLYDDDLMDTKNSKSKTKSSRSSDRHSEKIKERSMIAARNAVESLKGYLTSQELALSNSHRQGYINLELRMLHHECCNSLDYAGCMLMKGPSPRPNMDLLKKGILEDYRAPVLPLHKESLINQGVTGILSGALKQSVLRRPLIHATDSLSRARLMFGIQQLEQQRQQEQEKGNGNNSNGGGAHSRANETSARVILSIYNQMCTFYGSGYLFPIMESLRELLPNRAPTQPPQLPFDEEIEAPDLGVSPNFWVALERVHSASKSFDRELWGVENVGGSSSSTAAESNNNSRVYETLKTCGDMTSIAFARDERCHFYTELERRGEASIVQSLDTLSAHIQWVLVTGGESMLATGGTRIFNQLTGQSGGPYAIPSGASLDCPNSPAVKSLTYCLRVQFVHVQSALTVTSLSKFWTALSMRLYDILVARLLQHYSVSTVGAVILSRDVEALRSVAMLAGSDHTHWDTLRELLTLYMTPPDAIKVLLTGPEGSDSTKGLFAKVGRDECMVFMSRRNDYRYKTAAGLKKSVWVTEMLNELKIQDPTDNPINLGMFSAGRMASNAKSYF